MSKFICICLLPKNGEASRVLIWLVMYRFIFFSDAVFCCFTAVWEHRLHTAFQLITTICYTVQWSISYPIYRVHNKKLIKKVVFGSMEDPIKPCCVLCVDYSCAMQKEILAHGRLYISRQWICFYANIFRWETSVRIPIPLCDSVWMHMLRPAIVGAVSEM